MPQAAGVIWSTVDLHWVLRPSICKETKEARRRESNEVEVKKKEKRQDRQNKKECLEKSTTKAEEPPKVTLPDLRRLFNMPTAVRIPTQEVLHKLLFV